MIALLHRAKHAQTLSDRGIVHAPNVIPGNQPITVGHQYSLAVFLPEQTLKEKHIPWVLPLSTQRVTTSKKGTAVGLEQLNKIIPNFKKDLTVVLRDAAYSSPTFINGIQQH